MVPCCRGSEGQGGRVSEHWPELTPAAQTEEVATTFGGGDKHVDPLDNWVP